MKKNIGTLDRMARIGVGLAVIAGGFYLQSWWGAIGLVPLATGLLRWCPAYALFGVDSCGCNSKGGACELKS